MRQYYWFASHRIADNIAKPNILVEDVASATIWDDYILNGEGQEGKRRGIHHGTGELAFAFLGAIQEFSNNLGQLLTVLASWDETVLEAIDTLTAAQGAGGEVVEDKDQDIVCEDMYFVSLVGGPPPPSWLGSGGARLVMEATALSPESEIRGE
jgi:hypothetical protein